MKDELMLSLSELYSKVSLNLKKIIDSKVAILNWGLID
jgi:hypothetical protein